MDENIAITLLKEFREFRVENDKRWEENNKRWDENDKRWEENDKKWEENNKRWEENDKRWEENAKNLKVLNAKVEENTKSIQILNAKVEENTKSIQILNAKVEENTKNIQALNIKIDDVNKNTNARIDNLERIIKKDRIDLAEILDTMQKSITEQFKKQQEYMDVKFEKIFAAQRENEMEHQRFSHLLYNHESRLNLQNSRLDYLEKWKDEFDMGEFTAV